MVALLDSGLEWWLAHGPYDISAVASVGPAALKRIDSSKGQGIVAVAQPVLVP